MTAQEMLIKKFHIQLTLCQTTTFSRRKNNNIYIVEQLGTLHSYICIAAFHLGMIDGPREGCDVGAEPEDGEWQTRLEDGWMDPDVHDQRKMLAEYWFSN